MLSIVIYKCLKTKFLMNKFTRMRLSYLPRHIECCSMLDEQREPLTKESHLRLCYSQGNIQMF